MSNMSRHGGLARRAGPARPVRAGSCRRGAAHPGRRDESGPGGPGGSLLGCGGIVHDHSGEVFPAAAEAAPLLLDIARHGHVAARDAALGLLDEALSFVPHPAYARAATPHGETVRICCAVAGHVRSRAGFLAGLGRTGKVLLADAAAHWRFDVEESVADGDGTAAFGRLAGRLPPVPRRRNCTGTVPSPSSAR